MEYKPGKEARLGVAEKLAVKEEAVHGGVVHWKTTDMLGKMTFLSRASRGAGVWGNSKAVTLLTSRFRAERDTDWLPPPRETPTDTAVAGVVANVPLALHVCKGGWGSIVEVEDENVETWPCDMV